METYDIIMKRINNNKIDLTKDGQVVNIENIIKSNKTKLLLFDGMPGSGKTTLIKHIFQKLNSKSLINSPTFSIINQYNLYNDIAYHIDCYRIETEEEAINTGILECIESDKYCFIEWPQIIMKYITKALLLKIETITNDKRKIHLSTYENNRNNY